MDKDHDNDNIQGHANDNEYFPPIEETEEDLCRTLWIGVIVQAIIDATGKSANHLDQAKALEWLKGKGGTTSEFAEVCHLAGIDFELTRKRCEELVTGNGIDFRCLKKPKIENRANEDRKRYFRRAEKNARLRREKRELSIARGNAPGNDNQALGANDNSINQPTFGENL